MPVFRVYFTKSGFRVFGFCPAGSMNGINEHGWKYYSEGDSLAIDVVTGPLERTWYTDNNILTVDTGVYQYDFPYVFLNQDTVRFDYTSSSLKYWRLH